MSEPKLVPLLDWGCLNCHAGGQIEQPRDVGDVPDLVDAAHATASPGCPAKFRGRSMWVADPRSNHYRRQE